MHALAQAVAEDFEDVAIGGRGAVIQEQAEHQLRKSEHKVRQAIQDDHDNAAQFCPGLLFFLSRRRTNQVAFLIQGLLQLHYCRHIDRQDQYDLYRK